MTTRDDRIKERRETPRPHCSCSLSNSHRLTHDDCRAKPSVWYNGNEYFCIQEVMETRFYDDMIRNKTNIHICWSNNYLMEKIIEKEDAIINEGLETSGSDIRPEEGPGEPVGVYGRVSFEDSGDTLETEDAVGECYKC